MPYFKHFLLVNMSPLYRVAGFDGILGDDFTAVQREGVSSSYGEGWPFHHHHIHYSFDY